MYTIIDLNYIKRDSDGLVFTKESPEYQGFVDYCDAGSPVITVANPDIYETFNGKYRGKDCVFVKLSTSGKALRSGYLDANKKKKRGILIEELCRSVHRYVTGKNDASGMSATDIDNFIAAHGAILTLLSQNRHLSAKALIDAITPDQYVSQADLDAIQDMYDAYLPRISEII